jgi:3-methylcrotonyl-CoA carboxylase alpha subunit
LIAHGDDRPKATARLAAALDRLTVLGPATIRPFLVDAVRSPIFLAGHATTSFIADAFPQGWSLPLARSPVLPRLAATIWLLNQQAQRQAEASSPWSRLSAFRLSAPSGRAGACTLAVRGERGATQILVEGGPDRLIARDDSGESSFDPRLEKGALTVDIDGIGHSIPFAIVGAAVFLRLGPVEARYEVEIAVEAALSSGLALSEAGSIVASPMPGVLVELRVTPGAIVEAGTIVAVIESMKLFTDLKSLAAGRIARIAAVKGQTIAAGELILTIEAIERKGP